MVNPQPASSKYKQGHLPYVVGIVAFFAFFEVCPILPRKNETPFAMFFCCYTFNLYHQPEKKTWALYTCNLWQHHPLKLQGSLKRREGTKHAFSTTRLTFLQLEKLVESFFCFTGLELLFHGDWKRRYIVILWWHGCCFKRSWTCSEEGDGYKESRWFLEVSS